MLPNFINILTFKSNFILGLSGNMQEDDVPWVSLWFSFLCMNRITCCKVFWDVMSYSVVKRFF